MRIKRILVIFSIREQSFYLKWNEFQFIEIMRSGKNDTLKEYHENDFWEQGGKSWSNVARFEIGWP